MKRYAAKETGEQVLARLNQSCKKPTVKEYEWDIDENSTALDLISLTDRTLYQVWRNAIIANQEPERWLINPTHKNLAEVRSIFVTYLQVGDAYTFPDFLNTVFANFTSVKKHLYKVGGWQLPFEVHQSGVFIHKISSIYDWYLMYQDQQKDAQTAV